ncbi:hypothetical protein KEM54_001329 [Ascosphaera aggregata]|nr:hypothetical protein KEM54_001329 [Ascosphaera aggregata]
MSSSNGGTAANGSTPDLASVLRALSDSYRNVSTINPVAEQQKQSLRPLGLSVTEGDAHHTSSSARTFQQEASNGQAQGNVPGHEYIASQAQGNDQAGDTADAAKSDGQTVDPSMITTWPAALKYVMRTVGQNEQLQGTIRKLIHLQHESENKWWSERNALLEKQRARAGKQKQLDDVLRAIGGAVMESPAARTVEEDQKELHDYDSKVYRELVSLSRLLDRDLRALRIPFFAIHHDLVRQSGFESAVLSTPVAEGCITAEELGKLQKRILELLEDLCEE